MRRARRRIPTALVTALALGMVAAACTAVATAQEGPSASPPVVTDGAPGTVDPETGQGLFAPPDPV